MSVIVEISVSTSDKIGQRKKVKNGVRRCARVVVSSGWVIMSCLFSAVLLATPALCFDSHLPHTTNTVNTAFPHVPTRPRLHVE